MRLPRPLAGLLLALPLVLAACGDSGGGGSTAAPSSSGAAASSGSESPSTGTAAAGSSASGGSGGSSASGGSGGSGGTSAACTRQSVAVPAGARTAPTIDVDGDGRPDTEWIAAGPGSGGTVGFGVRTAAGGSFGATIRSASPNARSALVADVTGHGKLIALASDGRQVLLYAISSCSLVPEKNAQGQQYAFDLGFTGFGTGVGCVDANGDGTRDLVGLKLVTAGDGTPQSVQRTIITLSGPKARNGATSTVPVGSAADADTARSVTCGDLTLAGNGVASGQ